MSDLASAGADTHAVCLDFGTSFSKASAHVVPTRPGAAPVAPLRLGAAAGADQPYLTPTAIFIDQDRFYCGPHALLRGQSGIRAKRDPMLSFKMLLSAHDVDEVLKLRLPPTIDPTRSMSYRDGLILYLAYVDTLIRKAVGDDDLPAALADAPLRLTSPLWRGREAHQSLHALFNDAEFVSARLGASLATADGVSIEEARAALQDASCSHRRGKFAGVVTEVESAACAYLTFARPKKGLLLVVDIGAGTTDIAGFRMYEPGTAPPLEEIKAANACSPLACDEIDNALVQQMLRRSRAHSAESKTRVWRALRLAARDLKRTLFATGKCALEHEGRKIVLRKEALLKDAGFKDFCRAFAKTLSKSLEPMLVAARADRMNTITICLAGGGAHLPFMDSVVAQALKRRPAGLKIEIERFDKKRVREKLPLARNEQFEDAFSQMVISMGGVVASLTQRTAPALEAA